MAEQRTYLQGEPEHHETVVCVECQAHAAAMSQGKHGVMWCREGHVSLKVWSGEGENITYEWVMLNGNYPWE
jgi:hypothetical protein